jgi:hypothetical protein
MGRSRRAVASLVLLVLVAGYAGCAGGTDTSQSEVPKARTGSGVWGDLLATVGADGTWSKEVALTAFALQFGGLPGVDVPKTDETVPLFADESVNWITYYWDELDDAQRTVAKAKLLGTYDDGSEEGSDYEGGGPGKARPADTDEQILDKVDHWQRELESRLGVPLNMEITVEQVARLYAEGTAAWAVTEPQLLIEADGDVQRVCAIHFGGAYANALSIDEQDAVVAHELFHCFQADLFPGAFGGQNAKPQWWVEGSAAYVGEAVTNGSSLSAAWWDRYLTGSENGDGSYTLSRYSYSAIGMYALAASFTDIWSRLRSVLTSASTDAGSIFSTIVDTGPLAQWASSTLRHPSFGAQWGMSGPGITGASRTPGFISAAPGGTVFEIGELANGIVQVEGGGDVVTIDSVGNGFWHAEDGFPEGNAVQGPTTRRYCMRDTPCLCPDGSDSGGFGGLPQWPGGVGGITVAVAGGPGTSATVTASSLSLDEYCRDRVPHPAVARGQLVISGAYPLRTRITCDVYQRDMLVNFEGGSAVMPAVTGTYERAEFGPVGLTWGSGRYADIHSTWDVREGGRQGTITGTAFTSASLGRERFPFTAEWRCR